MLSFIRDCSSDELGEFLLPFFLLTVCSFIVVDETYWAALAKRDTIYVFHNVALYFILLVI